MKYLTMILFCVIMSACAQVADPNRIRDGDFVKFRQMPDREGQVLTCKGTFNNGTLCRVRYVENGELKIDLFKPFELRRK